jgi:hypothetical protein
MVWQRIGIFSWLLIHQTILPCTCPLLNPTPYTMQGPLLKHHQPDSSFKQLTHEAKDHSNSKDSVKDIDKDINLSHNLGDHQVILIMGVPTVEYAQTVAKVQEMGLPVQQDNMPYDPESSTVAIIIPEDKVEELATHITPLWDSPG